MSVELVPIKQFSARLEAGWQMIPGYPLQAGDYAVIMMPPTGARFYSDNKERASCTSDLVKQAKALSRKMEPAE